MTAKYSAGCYLPTRIEVLLLAQGEQEGYTYLGILHGQHEAAVRVTIHSTAEAPPMIVTIVHVNVGMNSDIHSSEWTATIS